MLHNHRTEDAAHAALHFGTFGALISGGIAAGQLVSATRQGRITAPQAVTDTLAAATKGGIAAAVGGATAAALGGHGVPRIASFLAGTIAAAWILSPRKTNALILADAHHDGSRAVSESAGEAAGPRSGTPKPTAS